MGENIQCVVDLIEKGRKDKNSYKHEKQIKDLLYDFVDNCPSKRGPEYCRKFSDYGFCCRADYGKYKRKIFEIFPQLKDNFKQIKSPDKIENYTQNILQVYNEKKTAVYFVKGKFGEIDTLFQKIRNAFAHKNYFEKDGYYIIWNYGKSSHKISCFRKLKYRQLIEIFELLKDKSYRQN